MSVRKNERGANTMEVHTKADELMDYTLAEIDKEKILPKRARWYLGNRIGDSVLRICTCLAIANSLSLDVPEEAALRRANQLKAMAETFALSSLLRAAWARTRFPCDTYEHWTGLVVDVRTLLLGWMRSDRSRTVGARVR